MWIYHTPIPCHLYSNIQYVVIFSHQANLIKSTKKKKIYFFLCHSLLGHNILYSIFGCFCTSILSIIKWKCLSTNKSDNVNEKYEIKLTSLFPLLWVWWYFMADKTANRLDSSGRRFCPYIGDNIIIMVNKTRIIRTYFVIYQSMYN